MFEMLARHLVRRGTALAVVVLTILVGAVCAVYAQDIEQDDDVLAFLPESNPQIRAFREISDRFGSTEVALVGIPTADPFEPIFLERLKALTDTLQQTEGVDSVLSLTSVADFVADPQGGIISDTLVNSIPKDDAGRAALREKVMSRDHIVGTLIDKEATAAQVLVFAASGQATRPFALRVRAEVEKNFPDTKIYWGGAPFFSTWIYDTTQADMAALTPWAIVIKLLILLVAFRSLLGMVLGVTATYVGLVVSQALMKFAGVPFNIVMSSMPVILIAAGSAYAIHILSHYLDQTTHHEDRKEALVHALTQTGPTTLVAGLTTVISLLSFITMDIGPMRTFGLFTSFGLFVSLVLSLTFVPAAIALFSQGSGAASAGPVDPFTRNLARIVMHHRGVSMAALAVLVIGSGVAASQAVTRMDLAAFFQPGSEPDQAQTFLEQRFGGSQFLQVLVEGDLNEPDVLREVGRIADRLATIPHVSDVQGVEGALGLVAEAMTGARRVPDTRGQLGSLYRFLASDRAAGRLVADDHQSALLQVKIDSSEPVVIDAVLAAAEQIIADEALHSFRLTTRAAEPALVVARGQDLVTSRLAALSHRFGVTLPPDAAQRVPAFLAKPPAAPDTAGLTATTAHFLLSPENFVTVTPEQASAVAAAVAALPAEAPLAPAIAAALAAPPDAPLVGDLALALAAPLADARRALAARASAAALIADLGVTPPAGSPGDRYVAAIASRLQELSAPDAIVADDAGAGKLAWTVSGMPVLYQGLAQSVEQNLVRSMGFALATVVVMLSLLYRSVVVGLLATAPTALTLILVYGAMAAAGIYLDIGTSMLAGLILGAGVDYAVHLLWGWDHRAGESVDSTMERAISTSCHGIWTNAVAMAAGFLVLTLGQAKPLQNVGALTASAMIVAAFATFIVIPLFAGARSYRTGSST